MVKTRNLWLSFNSNYGHFYETNISFRLENEDVNFLHLHFLHIILAPEILGNRNIKSRIQRFDWLLESLESSVVIGCSV